MKASSKDVGVSYARAVAACRTMTGYYVVRHPIYRDNFTLKANGSK